MKGKNVKFLYLSEEDVIKAGVLDGAQCVDVIDKMFKLLGQGDYLMGGPSENEHGIRIIFPEERRFPNMPVAGPDRRFMAMVAYLGGQFNVCACKWYGSNIINPTRGLPRSVLVVLLNDPDTGAPLALMSGNLISAMRTGSIPAVGAKYLNRKGADVAALIGAGVIGRATLSCLSAVMKPLKEARIFDISETRAEDFARQMSAELGIKVRPVASMQEAVDGSDFISIATAGKEIPTIETGWLKEGCVLSSQGWVNLDEEVFTKSSIVFDEWKMHLAWFQEDDEVPDSEAYKRMNFPSRAVYDLLQQGKIDRQRIRSLGPIAAGMIPARESDTERFIMLIGGLPTEDAAWGFHVYQNALRQGLGQELSLWKEPRWY